METTTRRRRTAITLSEHRYRKPNAETLAAIEEARSGVEMEDFDPNELDEYIYAAEDVKSMSPCR